MDLLNFIRMIAHTSFGWDPGKRFWWEALGADPRAPHSDRFHQAHYAPSTSLGARFSDPQQ